jgi:hypothetical protein
MEELVRLSTEIVVNGVPSLLYGRIMGFLPVMVSWDGRDLSVWMSIPEMERIDSWEVVRRRVGWDAEVQWGSSS